MTEQQAPMQEKKKLTVALDVGTTKVVAVAGYLDEHGKIKVADYAILQNTGMVQGEIFNLMETSQAIKHVINELSEKIHQDITHVTVGISGDHIQTIYTRDYIIRDNPEELIMETDIEKLTQRASQSITLEDQAEILEIIPQGYFIDNKLVNGSPVGTIGKRFEGSFLVILGKTKKINKLARSIKMAGLEIEDIFLQPIASARAVLKKPQCNLGVVLIDIGGGTTDILICNKGAIRFTGIIPSGGDYLTEEIYKHFHIEPKTAESIKLKYGSTMLNSEDRKKVYRINLEWSIHPFEFKLETLSNLIRVKLDLIASQIEKFIQEYQSFFPGEIISQGIVITGGGSQLKNMVQYMQYKLGTDVYLGKPGMLLAPSKTSEKLSKPQFSTVIGLLQMALEKNDAETALFDREKQEKPQRNNFVPKSEVQAETSGPEDKTEETSYEEESKKKSIFSILNKIFGKTIDEANKN